MISNDDITAFQEAHDASMTKADEYARRAFKGLPADRYASANDMYSVAQGIKAFQSIIQFQTRALSEQHQLISDMMEEGKQRSIASMEATSDPMR